MDPRIIQTKNGIIITPYEQRQCPFLENITSHWDQVYHKRVEDSGFLVPNYYNTPSFITHRQSKELLLNQFPGYTIMDEPKRPGVPTSDFSLKPEIHLTQIQEELAAELLNGKGYDEWFINLQTGQGKTVLSVHLTSMIQRKTLIVCFSTDILSQWVNTYYQKTTIDNKRVCFLDRNTILKFLKGKLDPDDYDIFLGTHALFLSIFKSEGYQIFDNLMNLLGIGMIIYDEAHRNMASIIKMNACHNFAYTIYLSADYGQADYKREQKFFKLFRRTKVLRPSEEEERSLKYTDVVMVEFNSHPTERDKMAIRSKYGYNSERFMSYEIEKGIIFDVIDFVLDSIYPANKQYRSLILASHVDHVDAIYEHVKEKYKNYLVGRYHGSMDEDEKNATLQFADIIVSTYKSFGTGKDEANIRYVIGTNQSNKIEDNQAAGRARPLADGSRVKYLFLVDKGFPYCVNKAKIRLNYLQDTKTNERPFIFRYPDL